MAKDIDPQLKTIREYFDSGVNDYSRQLVIPPFQRAYSWSDEQCDELWNDIDLYFQTYHDKKNAVPYFFGCIIFSEDEKKHELNIIDGQQRTITFLLLLKAIQLKIIEFLYGGKWIFSDDDNSKDLKKGLKNQLRSLFGMLHREEDIITTDEWDIIRNKKPVIITMSINEIRTSNSDGENKEDLDLYKILRLRRFEDAENEDSEDKVSVINRQGLSRNSPKRFTLFYRNFKNFYIKLCEILPKPENLYAWVDFFLKKCQIIQINSKEVGQAISMFNALNSKGMNLSDSDLVCSYLAVKAKEINKKQEGYCKIFEEKWEKFVHSVSELPVLAKGRNSDEKDAEKRKSILNQYMYYVRACDKETDSVSSVRDFYNTKIEKAKKSSVNFEPLPTCEALIKITQIWEIILEFPVVNILLKLNSNAQYFLISYLFKYELNDITIEIVNDIAENLMRLFAILRINSDSYSKSEFKGWLFTNNVEFVKPNNEKHIKQAFRRHIEKDFNKKEIMENLRIEIDNSIVFLKEYLFAKEHDKLDKFDLLPTTEIEHIMPQSGDKYEDIPEDAGLSEEEFPLYLNKLGNKILLEANINKHISNNWFRQKKTKKVSDKAGYKNSKYPIARSLVYYPKNIWQKEDIDKATEEASECIYSFIFPDD